jgi:DNA-directed RNA polymerase specialized sigma subunit
MERREELLDFWRAWKEALEETIKAEALVKLMAELDHTIRAAAVRFSDRGWIRLDFEDAYSIGRIGILRSIGKYRPELGFSVATFAYNTVKWVLLNTFKKLRRTVRFVDAPTGKDPDSWEDPFVARSPNGRTMNRCVRQSFWACARTRTPKK